MAIDIARGDGGGHMQPDQRRIGERGGERETQLAVLDHRAKRRVAVGGDEIEIAAAAAVGGTIGDLDGADRAAVTGESLSDPQHLEHLPGRAGDRRRAAVKARRNRRHRIGGIDDLDRQAVVRQGKGERLADQATTRNQDIAAQGLTHGPALARGGTVGKAMDAARPALDGESAACAYRRG